MNCIQLLRLFSFIIINDVVNLESFFSFSSFLLLHWSNEKQLLYSTYLLCYLCFPVSQTKRIKGENERIVFFSTRPIMNIFIRMCVRKHVIHTIRYSISLSV